MKQKFYYRWWFIALCCISGFFLPVGVILWILKTRSLQKEPFLGYVVDYLFCYGYYCYQSSILNIT